MSEALTSNQFVYKGTNEVINIFASKINYFEVYMCSCIGEDSGSFDPEDDCIRGFRYKSPVEYNLMRTAVDLRRVTQEVGKILQGGSLLTIPRIQFNHHAYIVTKDLSGNIDLSTNKNLKLSIDSLTGVEFDASVDAVDNAAVTIDELLKNINEAGLGEIAYESDANGDPNGINYITVRSLKILTDSKIEIQIPSENDATPYIFGLNSSEYPTTITTNSTISSYLPIYHKISRGDVITIESRIRRGGDLLRKGVRDTIFHFDVQRIVSISVRDTIYKEGIDFTHSDRVITWIDPLVPAAGTDYTVEYLCKQNYIVFDEMATDRGGDNDRVAKKIHLELRNYANPDALPIQEGS